MGFKDGDDSVGTHVDLLAIKENVAVGQTPPFEYKNPNVQGLLQVKFVAF